MSHIIIGHSQHADMACSDLNQHKVQLGDEGPHSLQILWVLRVQPPQNQSACGTLQQNPAKPTYAGSFNDDVHNKLLDPFPLVGRQNLPACVNGVL